MDNIMYVLFICIVVPLLLMLFLLDKKSRLTIGFMILGIVTCLFVSEINGILLKYFDDDMYYVTTTITPITEELVKALPILYFAFLFSDRRETLLSAAMAVGIGFAVLENSYILVSNIEGVTITWALIRGFGSGLMHGICTAAVGFGISFIHKRKKLFYAGTFALMTMAIIYHATYNCLVQSQYKYVGFLLPAVTYVPIITAAMYQKFKNRKLE